MAHGPIRRFPLLLCQIEGGMWKLIHFLFLDSKITVDNYCSHKIRRQLLLVRKVMTNLETKAKTLLC